jgi:hypothetical protein
MLCLWRTFELHIQLLREFCAGHSESALNDLARFRVLNPLIGDGEIWSKGDSVLVVDTAQV